MSVFKRFYCNIHNFDCTENTCIDISDHIYHYKEFINNRFGILVLQQRCKVDSCLEKPYTIRNVSAFTLLARQAGCITPTSGTNMRINMTCITLAGLLLDLAINPFTLKGYRGFSIELSLWVPKDEKSRRCLPGNMVLNFLQPNPIWPPSAKLRIIPFSLFAIYE